MSDAGGEKMKRIMREMGFYSIGDKKTPKGDIYVGERESWIGLNAEAGKPATLARKGLEVAYFIVSDDPTHGTPATYDPMEGTMPSRDERLHEAFRHAEGLLNG